MENEKKIEALEAEVTTLTESKAELEKAKNVELEEKASQVNDLTKELGDLKEEVESLRTFKQETEEAAARADRLKSIKTKLEEAGIEANIDDVAEADYWYAMTDEVLDKTIAKMGEIKKGASASAEVKVPPTVADGGDLTDTVRQGLKDRKQGTN